MDGSSHVETISTLKKNIMLKVYTIGPISGMSYKECVAHFTRRKEALIKMGFKVFHPMLGEGFLRNEIELKSVGYEDNPITTNKAITSVDFWRVDQSDILFADFTESGDRVSIGTVAEMSRDIQKAR